MARKEDSPGGPRDRRRRPRGIERADYFQVRRRSWMRPASFHGVIGIHRAILRRKSQLNHWPPAHTCFGVLHLSRPEGTATNQPTGSVLGDSQEERGPVAPDTRFDQISRGTIVQVWRPHPSQPIESSDARGVNGSGRGFVTEGGIMSRWSGSVMDLGRRPLRSDLRLDVCLCMAPSRRAPRLPWDKCVRRRFPNDLYPLGEWTANRSARFHPRMSNAALRVFDADVVDTSSRAHTESRVSQVSEVASERYDTPHRLTSSLRFDHVRVSNDVRCCMPISERETQISR